MAKPDLWDAAARARVSDRWAKASADWNTATTDALLTAAALNPDSMVLDLAAGSGESALSVAQRLIGGRVIALDRSRAGLLLPAHAVETWASRRRSCASRVTHTLSHSGRIAWTASLAAAASCSLATLTWLCQKCFVCSSLAGV